MAPLPKMIKKAAAAVIITLIILSFFFGLAFAKIKFYNFEDQLINGEIQRPTNLYFDAREKVQFEQLLKLKKSFIDELFDTGKNRIFK